MSDTMNFEVVEDDTPQAVAKQSPALGGDERPKAMMTSPTSAAMVQYALENDKGLETIERLIALKNSEEERAAKKEFDVHFAEMQRDFMPVKRSKEAKNSGKVMYTYAPIEALQSTNGYAIARHGFSYTWEEQAMEEGGRRFTLVISGWGHTQKTTFDIPKIQGTSLMNPAQAVASMSTYGRRYSFMLGFGMVVEDEDDDAESLTFEDGVKYGTQYKALRSAKTLEELKTAYTLTLKELDGDDYGRGIMADEKNKLIALIKSGGTK